LKLLQRGELVFEPLFKELAFYLAYAIEGAAALIMGLP
jgi:hypothetical protein